MTNKSKIFIMILLIVIVLLLSYIFTLKQIKPTKNFPMQRSNTLICNINSSYDTPIASCTCPSGYSYKMSATSDKDSKKYYRCSPNSNDVIFESNKKISYSLITPNGGEQIKAGSIYEIKWDPNQFKNIDNVDISLNDDSIKCSPMSNGCWSSFDIISTKNTGSYLWDTSKKLFGDAGPDTIDVSPNSNYRISISANSITLKSKNTFSVIY